MGLLVEYVRDAIIEDGIAEVERVYHEGDPRREGALEGFALCRLLLLRSEFADVLRARYTHQVELRYADPSNGLEDYRRYRYATLQVEWVRDCLSPLWGAPTVGARALRKLSEVLGRFDTPDAVRAAVEASERP